jgi:transcriptional regulator with XRE-family HTH domain
MVIDKVVANGYNIYVYKSELKKWMKRFKCNQSQLAKSLGVSRMCVSRWVSGKRKIPPFLIYALKWIDYQGGVLGKSDTKTKKKGGQ